MKVAVDLTPLYGRKWTGVEMYAIDLYHALMNRGYDVVPIFNEKNELDSNPSTYIVHGTSYRVWLENVLLSAAVRRIGADVVLFPIFPPPVDLYWFCKSKIVPVIHDTAFRDFYSTLKPVAKYYLKPKCELALKKADYIVTISEDAKRKIERFTNRQVLNWKENISADYLPQNIKVSEDDLLQFGVAKGGYYVSVSTIEPRKNLKFLLKSIKQTLIKEKRKLVLVGRQGWGSDKELNGLMQSMQDLMIFTGYASLECMQSLYHYAHAFVLLSVEEGFGRTPLEAIACGCKRIIVSDIPVFHEVLGDSVNYIGLNNVLTAESIFEKGTWKEVADDFSISFDALEKSIDIR